MFVCLFVCFSLCEITLLLYNSGVLQKQNSGFEGSWVPAETNLNNEFYTFIVGGQDEASARPLSQFEQELQDNSAFTDFDDQYLVRFRCIFLSILSNLTTKGLLTHT